MVHFAAKRNATSMSVTHFHTLLSFLTSNSKKRTGGRAYADVITKISDIDKSSFSFFVWVSAARA